jgi:hypothetical protein
MKHLGRQGRFLIGAGLSMLAGLGGGRLGAQEQAAAVSPASAGGRVAEVRFLNLAPSIYTHRYDSLRAGLGIALELHALIEEQHLPIKITFRDAVSALDQPEAAKALLHGADVLVLGGETWSQGSTRFERQFFEETGSEALWGVRATAYTSAGGNHTGGEMVIGDTLRSLMGMGASVFSLGQKYMVFTTDERTDDTAPGHFELIDVWFMEQFAKAIALEAVAANDAQSAAALAARLHLSHAYYRDFPKEDAALRERLGGVLDLLNAAAKMDAGAYEKIGAQLGFAPNTLHLTAPPETK